MTVCDLILPILKKQNTIFDPNTKKEEMEVTCASMALSVLVNSLMKVYFDNDLLDEMYSELGVYTDALRDVVSKNLAAKKLVTQMIDDGTAYNSFKEAALEQIPENMRDDLPKTMPEFCRASLELIFHPAPKVEQDIDNIWSRIRKH